MGTQEDKIKALETRNYELREKVSALETDVDELGAEVDSLNAKITDLTCADDDGDDLFDAQRELEAEDGK